MFKKNNHIILLFLIAIFLLFGNNVKAIENNNREYLINQIEILKKEIKRLTNLIDKINLEKEISAGSYLIKDIINDSIILEKEKIKPYPMASITKLMTSIVAIENIDIEKEIVLNEEMLSPIGYSPSLFLGLKVSGINLLKATLIQSTNDAANALSYFLGKDEFILEMNRKAKELQMDKTNFSDPHGLSLSNNSTSLDLSKIIEYIYENHPQILEISKENDFWLPNEEGRMLKFKNVNNFFDHPQFVGGKTGYLIEAKQTFASIFNINEKLYSIVLLYSKDRQKDTMNIIKYLESL